MQAVAVFTVKHTHKPELSSVSIETITTCTLVVTLVTFQLSSHQLNFKAHFVQKLLNLPAKYHFVPVKP